MPLLGRATTGQEYKGILGIRLLGKWLGELVNEANATVRSRRCANEPISLLELAGKSI